MSDQPLPPAQPSDIRAQIHQRASELAINDAEIPRLEHFIDLAEFGPKSLIQAIATVPFVRYKRGRERALTKEDFATLNFQLDQAVQDPETFLVVTPEYSLFSLPTNQEPILLGQDNQIAAGQPEVVATINYVRDLALKSKITFVLSSICERVALSSGKPVTYNTTLIIDPEGNINPVRKLTTDIFASDGKRWDHASEAVQEYVTSGTSKGTSVLTDKEVAETAELALDTIKPKEVRDKKGNCYMMSVFVCNDVLSKEFLKVIVPHVNPNTNLVTVPYSEGGHNPTELYEEHANMWADTEAVQKHLQPVLGNKNIIYVLNNGAMGVGAIVAYDQKGEMTEAKITK